MQDQHAARIEQRAKIQAEARMRSDRRPHADASGGRRRVQGAVQIRRAGKERGRVAIIAHAEHRDIERPRDARESLPRRHRAEIRRGRRILQAEKRAAAARSLSNTSRTSFSLLPASVGSTQRSSASATQTRLQSSAWSAQLLEQLHRRAAARYDQARDAPLGDAACEMRGDAARHVPGQGVHARISFGLYVDAPHAHHHRTGIIAPDRRTEGEIAL